MNCDHEYERQSVNGCCPECGQQNITRLVTVDGPPVPYDRQATCDDCGHVDDPLVFVHEHTWREMSDDERARAERLRAQYESRKIDYAYSAHGIAERREP